MCIHSWDGFSMLSNSLTILIRVYEPKCVSMLLKWKWNGFKPPARWISGRPDSWTDLATCLRWCLRRHDQKCLSHGAQADSSQGPTCTCSCEIVHDRWLGEVLLSLSFTYHRCRRNHKFDTTVRIFEILLGSAGRIAAHVLQEGFSSLSTGCGVAFLSWNARFYHCHFDQVRQFRCQWRSTLGPVDEMVCGSCPETRAAWAVCRCDIMSPTEACQVQHWGVQ